MIHVVRVLALADDVLRVEGEYLADDGKVTQLVAFGWVSAIDPEHFYGAEAFNDDGTRKKDAAPRSPSEEEKLAYCLSLLEAIADVPAAQSSEPVDLGISG